MFRMPEVLVVVMLTAMIAFSQPAMALPGRVDLIPNGERFSCLTCHLVPGGPRNPFGKSAESVVKKGSLEPFWDKGLASEDPDKDGPTNGEELQDPTGSWTPGRPDPGEPSKVTNPGVRDGEPEHSSVGSTAWVVAPFGIATFTLLLATLLAGLFMPRNRKVLYKWHRKLAVAALAMALLHGLLAILLF